MKYPTAPGARHRGQLTIVVLWLGLLPAAWSGGGMDAFENDDTPLRATLLTCCAPLDTPQDRTFHNDADEDWISFPESEQCVWTMTHRLVSTDRNPDFHPIVETYSSEILTNPNAAPVAVFGDCRTSASSLEFDSGRFFWRIRNCSTPAAAADKGILPTPELSYRLEIVERFLVCADVAVVQGFVREAGSLDPVPLAYVATDQNLAGFTQPLSGSQPGHYRLALNNAAQVDIDVVSEVFGASVSIFDLLPGETRNVDIVATRFDPVFADGFENQ